MSRKRSPQPSSANITPLQQSIVDAVEDLATGLPEITGRLFESQGGAILAQMSFLDTDIGGVSPYVEGEAGVWAQTVTNGLVNSTFDNISAVQEYLKQGKVLCTVDQHADQLAAFGIEHALAVLGGGETVSDKDTPVDLITAESLQ